MSCNHGQGKEVSSAMREATKGSGGLLHGGPSAVAIVTSAAMQMPMPMPPAPRGATGTRSQSCRLKQKLGNGSWYKQISRWRNRSRNNELQYMGVNSELQYMGAITPETMHIILSSFHLEVHFDEVLDCWLLTPAEQVCGRHKMRQGKRQVGRSSSDVIDVSTVQPVCPSVINTPALRPDMVMHIASYLTP